MLPIQLPEQENYLEPILQEKIQMKIAVFVRESLKFFLFDIAHVHLDSKLETKQYLVAQIKIKILSENLSNNTRHPIEVNIIQYNKFFLSSQIQCKLIAMKLKMEMECTI